MSETYSLQQAKDDMMKMWLWLSENPTKTKFDYLRTFDDNNRPCFPFNCPLCLYVGRAVINISSKLCSLCPVEWTADDPDFCCPCLHDDSPFEMWECAETEELSKRSATEVYLLAKNIDTSNQGE